MEKTLKLNYWSNRPKNFTGCVINRDGSKAWYKDGKRHRTNGPAVECIDGSKAWYKNGELHRINGPAVEWSSGYKEYWINGMKIDEKTYKMKFMQENDIRRLL